MKLKLLLFMAFLSIACGSTSGIVVNMPIPATQTPQEQKKSALPVKVWTGADRGEFRTLGKLRVRECPSTSCPELGFLEAGAIVPVIGEKIVTDCVDCRDWYPVRWRTSVGYSCADWIDGSK